MDDICTECLMVLIQKHGQDGKLVIPADEFNQIVGQSPKHLEICVNREDRQVELTLTNDPEV